MPLPSDSPLHAAVRKIIEAAEMSDPLPRIEALLHALTSEFHASGGLEEEEDEVLLHAAPNLTIYHITLSPGLQYPLTTI